MLKFTLDTNTLISATIARGNEFELMRLAKEGKIRIILSLPIIEEFKEVISREKFGFSARQIEQVTKLLFDVCDIVIPTVHLSVIKDDPDDNKLIECAVSGNVDYIVSGDKHLLNIQKYGNIPIIRTREALALINKQDLAQCTR